MSTDAEVAARALLSALGLMAREMPGMQEKPAGPGVVGLVTGIPVATLNGVFTGSPHPDIREVAAAADGMTGLEIPWSMQFRGEPGLDAGRLAARYGLTGRELVPLMSCRAVTGRPAPGPAASRVRVMRPGDRSGYAAALAAGYEAPPGVMAPFSSPEMFAIPGVVPYLAAEDGEVVSVGLGVLTGEFVGVFCVATVPGYRGRGYGRAVTERIVTDGMARGARLAYLQASADGYPLYQSMGFRTVESWTYLVPAE